MLNSGFRNRVLSLCAVDASVSVRLLLYISQSLSLSLETFVEDLKTNVFYNFIHFVSPAVKLSRAGRRSGGVLLLIKKSLADYVQEISLGVENRITMKL